jgi:L-threonylcarbamoyladenylate synthase
MRRPMKTKLIKEDIFDIDPKGIARAAQIIKRGGLVGIPTETVYGLAANALDETAVGRIFKAKGRPQDNPLIVHVTGRDWVERYALEIPKKAFVLMDAFWPGPLTVILKKSPDIPDIVSAGLPSAAFRCPSHPVAAAIIKEAGVPVAAPSANSSGRPSPTRAEHVLKDLGGKIDAVVDSGECGVGVESTVISLCTEVPRVFRPGGVTVEQLREVIGEVEVDRSVLEGTERTQKAQSPGMKYRHYAPKAKLTILTGDLNSIAAFVNAKKKERGVWALCFDGEEKFFEVPSVAYGAKGDGASQARRLFDSLRRLDENGAKKVYARCPENTGVGLAVYNRLLRAADFEVLEIN